MASRVAAAEPDDTKASAQSYEVRFRLKTKDWNLLKKAAVGNTPAAIRKWVLRHVLDDLSMNAVRREAAISKREIAVATEDALRERLDQRQTVQKVRDAQRQGRSEGEWYLRLALWLDQTPSPVHLPPEWETWLTAHPAVWANVRKMLINSPSMGAYCRWQELWTAETARTGLGRSEKNWSRPGSAPPLAGTESRR